MWVGLDGYELRKIGSYVAKAAAFGAGVLVAGYIGFRCASSSFVSDVTPFEQDTVVRMQRDMRDLEGKLYDGARDRTAKSAKRLYEDMRDGLRDRME